MRLPVWLRVVVFVFACVLPVAGTRAQDAPIADQWQATISGQIEALRVHDSGVALSFAGAPFHDQFTDAEQFYTMVVETGYLPIVTSRSHSFGAFRYIGTDDVVQQVFLVGEDQSLYQAIYEVRKEEAGWRVFGVQLAKTQGVGI